MYESDPHFRSPSDPNIRVWRYLDFANLCPFSIYRHFISQG